MSLLTLPILPLEVIVSYLDFSSLVSLANSHPLLAHLQTMDQDVSWEDFSVAGIGGWHWHIQRHKHDPEPYFDVKIQSRGLLGIKMVWEWKGQVYMPFAKATFVLIKDNRVENLIRTSDNSCNFQWVRYGTFENERHPGQHSTSAQLWLQLMREEKVRLRTRKEVAKR